jgi:hypothetical protein
VPEKRLAVDNPIDFDLQDFYSKCGKCATSRRCGEWVSGLMMISNMVSLMTIKN